MRYLALATDYDGTLAKDGQVDEPTLAALERFRDSGRRLILVTGRELDELLEVFPQVDLFERVVAENGALLYRPAGREEKVLGEPPPAGAGRGDPEAGGQSAVGRARRSSPRSSRIEVAVLEAIRELGLEWQVIFNKGSVMVLPSGVNKATGLSAALEELNLSPHNVVGVGDAENDHAFLGLCEFSAAVANALPMLKERADFVTDGARGAGVVELIDRVLDDDLEDLSRCLARHRVLLGHRDDGSERVDRMLRARTCWSPARPAAASRRSRRASSSAWPSRVTSSWWWTPRGITRRSKAPSSWATRSRRRPSTGRSTCSTKPAARTP